MKLQAWLRLWLPPALRAFGNRVSGNSLRFSGDYDRWQDAARQGRYDSASILQRVAAATDEADRLGLVERDGHVLDVEEPPGALVAALQLAARYSQASLNVVDFGGGLGTHWRVARGWQGTLPPMRWRIVEQGHFAAAGRERSSDPSLQFDDSLWEALTALGGAPDLLIASSVLPYLEQPRRQFAEFLACRPRYLLLDRMPFLESGKDRLCVQTNPRVSGGHRYPCWLFAPDAFQTACREAGYSIVANWAGSDGVHSIDDRRIVYRGQLLWRKN